MNSLSDAVGAGVRITIKGEDLLLQPIGLADLGAVENELRAMRPNVLKMAAEAAESIKDPVMRESLMDRAWREAKLVIEVTPTEVFHFIQNDINGIAFSIWLMVQKARPGQFSKREVFEWLEELSKKDPAAVEDIVRRRDIASGLTTEHSQPSPTTGTSNRKKRRGARRSRGQR